MTTPSKLLLADSSPMMQRIVELTFSREDVQVLAARDGEDAIARIPLDRPDIVLADHALPGRSGYEVAAFVKGRPDLAHIPVLLLSGAFEPVDRIRAAQVGSDGVVVKPFEPQQLVERVRELVARGRTAREAAARTASADGPHGEDEDRRQEATRARADASAERQRFRGALDDYFDELDTALGHLGREPGGIWGAPAEGPGGSSRMPAVDDPRVPTLDALLGPQLPQGSGGTHDGALPPDRQLEEPPAMAGEDAQTAPEPGTQEPPGAERSRLADLGELADALNALARREAALASPAVPVPAGPEPLDPAQADATRVEATHVAVRHAESRPAGDPASEPASSVVSDAVIEEVTRRVIERLTPDAIDAAVSRIVQETAERLLREELERLRTEGTLPRSTMTPDISEDRNRGE